MSLAAYAVRRPVATLSAILAVVLLGSVSLSRLPVSLLPDVSLPVLTIRTGYTGAAAPEVSRFVAEPIEEAIGATPRLTELRSVSRNNEVTTTARFEWGTDMRATVLSVRERLDAARSQLPERADRPTLLTSDPGERPIAVLAIKQSASQAAKDSRAQGGGDLRSLARTATEVHARRLEQIEGVSSVAVVGAPDDEIRVELDPEKLRALDLTPEDVAAAIRAENATGAGGTIRKGQFRFSVRALTEFRNPSEILETPIGPVGAGITLRDVGTVSLGLADPQTLTRLDGASAIGMVVYKDAGSNTVAVTRRMTDAIAQLEKEFPGVSMTVVAAQADFVVDALSNLGQEIVAGGLLSLLVIFVFLRDWRLSLAIGVTVPLSVLMALVALQALDVSINVLSLGGLALGTGLLVDTAIVVAESVGRRREEGMSLSAAAVTGTDEVAAPLFAGTLTTVLVFGPIIFVRGLAAALFRDLSLSVVTTVAASLLLALTLMPVMIVGRRKLAKAAPAPVVVAKEPTAIARTLDAWGRRCVVGGNGGAHRHVAQGNSAARGRRRAGGRGATARGHQYSGHGGAGGTCRKRRAVAWCHRHLRTRGQGHRRRDPGWCGSRLQCHGAAHRAGAAERRCRRVRAAVAGEVAGLGQGGVGHRLGRPIGIRLTHRPRRPPGTRGAVGPHAGGITALGRHRAHRHANGAVTHRCARCLRGHTAYRGSDARACPHGRTQHRAATGGERAGRRLGWRECE